MLISSNEIFKTNTNVFHSGHIIIDLKISGDSNFFSPKTVTNNKKKTLINS